MVLIPGSLRIRSLPSVGKLFDRTGLGHGLQGVQRIQNNTPVTPLIARFAEHAAAREFDLHHTGRFDLGCAIGAVAD